MDKQLKKLSELILGTGVIIAVLGGCCIDSPEPYGTMALMVVVIGGAVAGLGYALMIYESTKKKDLSDFHQKDKLDGDITYISYDSNGKEVIVNEK